MPELTYKTQTCTRINNGFKTCEGFKSDKVITTEYEDYREYLKAGFMQVDFDFMYELELLVNYINKK